MTEITIRQPDDWHLHVRDGAVLPDVMAQTARCFARAIIMPNLKPPVVTTKLALEYRQRILSSLKPSSHFQPLMTLYLTDNTDPNEIKQAKQSEQVFAVKYYPAGATTNSDSGVTSIKKTYPALEELSKQGMPLLIHGEVTDPDVDIFEREKRFIDTVLVPLSNDFPELKIVLEHITTKDAVEFVSTASDNIAATITPHHLIYNRNAMFKGGIRPHYYCLPILKHEQHRLALVNAAISGNTRFFLGTDSAPHAVGAKESSCGCAGIYNAPVAIEVYAQVFAENNALDKLEKFASEYGPAFYGLPLNEQTITLKQADWTVPDELSFANDRIIPMCKGESISWTLVDPKN